MLKEDGRKWGPTCLAVWLYSGSFALFGLVIIHKCFYLDLQVGLIAVFFFFVSTWLAMIQSCKIGCHVSLCGSLVSLNADLVKQMALSEKCV
jgi:hypothetical protein